jgi:hypothetical protein
MLYSIQTPTFSNNRKFKTKISLSSVTDIKGYVVSGDISSILSFVTSTKRHFGFYILDNALYGTCADGTTQSTVLLQSISATQYLLEAVFTASGSVKFYVDGTYKDQLTTNLPSGTTGATTLIFYGLKDDSGAGSKHMTFDEVLVLQD